MSQEQGAKMKDTLLFLLLLARFLLIYFLLGFNGP